VTTFDRRPAAHGRFFRIFVLTIVVCIAWVPGFVALAMLLSGNAG
jgi:hypothetical protein